jgi:hypothetical protein
LSLSLTPEAIVAKKPAKAATKTKKKPAKKAERIEIELDPVETKAFELLHSSASVCKELESAVTAAIAQAVRKVFKQHRIALAPSQAEEVAAILFGD